MGWKNDQTQLAEGWGILGSKGWGLGREAGRGGNCSCTSALGGPLGCPAPPAQRQAGRRAGFAPPGGAVLLEALLPALRKVAEPELRTGRADVQKRAQAQQYWL